MLKELVQIIESVPFEDCAHCVHADLMQKLVDAGFGCQREVDAYYRTPEGNVKRGRIDILAFREGKRAGIEMDNCTPRPRSVSKLLGMDLDYRIIVLRKRTRNVNLIRGIDAILYIQQPRGYGGNGNLVTLAG